MCSVDSQGKEIAGHWDTANDEHNELDVCVDLDFHVDVYFDVDDHVDLDFNVDGGVVADGDET